MIATAELHRVAEKDGLKKEYCYQRGEEGTSIMFLLIFFDCNPYHLRLLIVDNDLHLLYPCFEVK